MEYTYVRSTQIYEGLDAVNEMTAQGWELYSVTPEYYPPIEYVQAFGKYEYLFILRRPKPVKTDEEQHPLPSPPRPPTLPPDQIRRYLRGQDTAGGA